MWPLALVVGLAGLGLVGWKELRKAKRACIAVMGHRGAGKTHLITFLTTGSIPKTNETTLHAKYHKQVKETIKKLELNFVKILDTPGGAHAEPDWEGEVKRADCVFYLLDLSQIKSHESLINSHLLKLQSWLQKKKGEGGKAPVVFLIGTHADKLEGFGNVDGSFQDQQTANIEGLSRYQDLRAAVGDERLRVKIGSMKDLEGTSQLAFALLSDFARLRDN